MDRWCCRSFGWTISIFLLLSAAVLCGTGCNILATAMYVLQGTDVQAEFNQLRGKRVAVVCRPVSSLQYRYSSAAREIAGEIGRLLQKNVPKIKIVDQREISDYTDENDWDEYVEIGKAVGADMVVAIDLQDFNLYQGATVYQGRANLTIAVYDTKKGREPIYSKTPPQMLYPPNSPIAAGETPEPQFRAQFIRVMAEQISRNFYDHDSTIDFAPDSATM